MLARVARIPYLNAAPFYLLFSEAGIPLLDLPPRAMGEAARTSRVDAGPFSLMDWFGLEDSFDPVGDFVIATKRKVGSVLLFSRVPAPDLPEGSCVALDGASSTGAALTRVLLESRFKVRPVWAGQDVTAPDARLLIGDPALAAARAGLPGLPHVPDLGEAWWEWHRLPFVFAVWGIRRTLPPEEPGALADLIGHSLKLWNERLAEHAAEWAGRLGMPADEIRAYLAGLTHRAGPEERESIETFRSCVAKLPAAVAAPRGR